MKSAPAPPQGERYHRLAVLGLVTIPLLGFVAAVAVSWRLALLRPVDLVLLAFFYLVTGLGITGGYHRLFCHRSFRTSSPLRAALAIAGSMAAEGPLIRWVAGHRLHHNHSDREGDPHSPHHHGDGVRGLLRGLWHAQLGWFLKPHSQDVERYARDLLQDPALVRIDRLFLLWVGVGLAVPAAVGMAAEPAWQGALLGFLWGGLARIFLVQHVTWSINSICHVFGSRSYRSVDKSTNNWVCGIVGLGEGWHNNHHAFPNSARHGLKRWQLDLTWLFISTLERLGLVWDVKRLSRPRLAANAL
ncbi:MAG: acyl-CoA desaturase [Thermoanaerobaculia bacterium]